MSNVLDLDHSKEWVVELRKDGVLLTQLPVVGWWSGTDADNIPIGVPAVPHIGGLTNVESVAPLVTGEVCNGILARVSFSRWEKVFDAWHEFLLTKLQDGLG